MVKGKRGLKFSTTELEHLLDAIEEFVPIGNPEWERVWNSHQTLYEEKERTVESLKRKFSEVARMKIPTGDPTCPPHIRRAKRISRKIVQATDGSTGNSDAFGDLGSDFGIGGKDDESDEDDLIGNTGDIPTNVNVSNLFLEEEESVDLGNSLAVKVGGVQGTSMTSETPASSSSSGQKRLANRETIHLLVIATISNLY